MRALGGREPQRLGDGLEHVERRAHVAPLLEPRVPGGAHPGEQCDLFAPQARGALDSDYVDDTRIKQALLGYRQRDRMPSDATMQPKPTARFQYRQASTGYCCDDR